MTDQRRAPRYAKVYAPEHSRAIKINKGNVLEHLVVAERVLGRPFPRTAQVHHIDGNGFNNANDNLVICQDQVYHNLLHMRLRAFNATGDPRSGKCTHCHCWDNPESLLLVVFPTGRSPARHVYYHRTRNGVCVIPSTSNLAQNGH